MKGMISMKVQVLGELVAFLPGLNPTRAEKKYHFSVDDYYDQNDFLNDYKVKKVCGKSCLNHDLGLDEGDIVISVTLQKAAIVSHANVGKVPTLNFVKVEFKSDVLDKKYFVYLFNEHSSIQRQKARELQGTGSMLRIPISSLNELKVPIIPLSDQKIIGEAYMKLLKLNTCIDLYKDLMNQSVKLLFEDSIKGV